MDPIIYAVYYITLNGWPNRFSEVPHIACQFGGARDELTIDNRLLLKGNRVCIPPELYQRMLSQLHGGHKGVEKMQHLTREKIYWQGIDTDITEYVKHCKICNKHKTTQAVQPMMPKDVPEGPVQDLAADFFQHNNTKYLLIADTFSNYSFLYKISSKAADSITQRIKSLISQYGPPKTLSTDNGPPFSSEAFTQFMQKEHIDCITSSPHYSKSNRFIERQIKTALSTHQEAKLPIEDLLLNIRTQPIGPHLPPPRESCSTEQKNAQVNHHVQLTWKTCATSLSARKQCKRKTMTKVTKSEYYQTSFQVRKFICLVQQTPTNT